MNDGTIPLDKARQAQRREFIDTRVRSEPKPRFAPGVPSIFDADCARWVGREPPEVPFTVAGLIPEGMTTLLVAHGGVGKSMVSQTAMTCIPTGLPLFGRVTTSGNTAGVFAEDPAGVLHARQCRINDALGVDMEQLAGRAFPQSYSGMDAYLWRGGKTTPFFDRLEGELRRLPELRFVALDNVALLFADNENDRIAVSGFLSALNGMAARLNVGILLSTHTSKSNEDGGNRIASGSTAWLNACRSVLVLKGDDADPNRVTLKLAKANHARRGDEIKLVWRDGVLALDELVTGTVAGIVQRSAERAFLACLHALADQGFDPSFRVDARGLYAPKLMLGRPEVTGFDLPALERAMRNLMASGEAVIAESEGPPSRRKKIIVPKDHPRTKPPSA